MRSGEGAEGVVPTVPGVTDLVAVGEGGYGVVYRGHQTDFGREVAVKVLLTSGVHLDAVERWRREITAMGRLSDHPNIVAVYSAGLTDDGRPYLVMPFASRGSLQDRITREGPIAPAPLVRMGSDLAGALGAAHAAGVLHRDVKPANVLLSEYGGALLSDFGIARLVDSAATATTSIHATIAYAAPEVLSGEPATPASDVYGLGATLHAAARGESPFGGEAGESLTARVGRVLTQPPADLRTVGVPSALAAVIESCMAKDPAQRPATADQLQALLAGVDLAGGASAAPNPAPSPAAPPAGSTAVLPAAAGAPPPQLVPPPPRSDERGRTGPRWVVVAALVVALLGVSAVAAWALSRDRGAPADAVAADGGATDDVAVDGGADGSETTASPSVSTSPAPTVPTTPSTVPATPSTTTSTTTLPPPTAPPPTAPATVGPFPTGSWITVLSSSTDRSAVERFRAESAPGAEIVDNDQYASLTPGYYAVAFGPYSSSDAALDLCFARGLFHKDQCFAAYLSQNSADRGARAYPDE